MSHPPVSAMDEALGLARSARLVAPPNPAVGCVLVDAAGQVLGTGATQRTGGPHAEIMALRDAESRGHAVEGATAYVTLEPCAHHGRTGPCCDALVRAGVARVVAAATDPNPLVAGQGFERLRAAGVEVQVLPPTDPVALEARELNLGFFSRMVRQRPWVRMKVAASLDGQTALVDGRSQWITSEAARADGHAWRARADAVLTGIGTVMEDDPLLDVRLADTPRQPALVVVDSRMELPLAARLFGPERKLLVYAAVDDPAKRAALEGTGATVVVLPNPAGKVDLASMLHDLAVREVNEVHVESGAKLNGSLVREGLVDEFVVYLAPKLLGAGRGMLAIGPLAGLDDAVRLEFRDVERIGADLRIVARIPGRDSFQPSI